MSEIGFGCWAIGGNAHGNSYGATDDKVSLEAIARAIDLGCNFFDTADVYGWGHSEELLGKAIKGKRDHLIIATKVGGDFYQGHGFQTFTSDYIHFALEKTLQRLKTDYVDVYQLHNPPMKLIKRGETYEALKQLKRDGKIRAWGVSVFDPQEGLAALEAGQPDSIQVVYNVFSPKPADELFPRASKKGCAIIAREPLANGFLVGKFGPDAEFETGDIRHSWPREYIRARVYAAKKLDSLLNSDMAQLAVLALKYVLMNQYVSVVIPGMKTAQQALENLAASDCRNLNDTELDALRKLQLNNFEL